MKLHSESVGEGRDLVLLHGWAMHAGVWEPLVELLASRYRLTLVDLPGHGASTWGDGQTTLDDWSRAVLAVAPPQAFWLGWSLGAEVAINAALLEPARVTRLVAVAGTPCYVQKDDWEHAMPAATFQQFASSVRQDPAGALGRFLALQVRGADGVQDVLRRLRRSLAARPAAQAGALDAGLELLQQTDLRQRLQELVCPVLWLLGERDTLVPAGVAADLENLMPEAGVALVAGAAHAPFLSHTSDCLGLVDGFLRHG